MGHFDALFLWDNLGAKEVVEMEKAQESNELIVSHKGRNLLLLLLF